MTTGPKCCDECPGDDTCEHATVCMCGDHMEGHDSMWSGHSAVSMHDYHCRPAAPPQVGDGFEGDQ